MDPVVLALCVDGVQDEALVAAATPWIGRFARVEAWCAYGDEAARDLAAVRERHGRPHHPPPPPHHHDDPDRAQAEAIANAAIALLRERGISATPRVLGGGRDPGHAVAAASTPDIAVFLSSGHRGGIGPKSIGHTARFIIDHATGPVIVVRL
jgi:nucleotide-binding universal stress UspA family protein